MTAEYSEQRPKYKGGCSLQPCMIGLYKAKLYTTRALGLRTSTALYAAPCLRLGIQTNPPELARPETQLSTRVTVIWSTVTSRGTPRTMNCSEAHPLYSPLKIYDGALAHTSAPPNGRWPGNNCPLFLIKSPKSSRTTNTEERGQRLLGTTLSRRSSFHKSWTAQLKGINSTHDAPYRN